MNEKEMLIRALIFLIVTSLSIQLAFLYYKKTFKKHSVAYNSIFRGTNFTNAQNYRPLKDGIMLEHLECSLNEYL